MILPALTATALLLTTPAFADTLRFAVTDIDGMETMQQEFGAFEEALEYVVIKELTSPEIVAAWQRPNYYAQIVTMAKGDIRRVEDLKGKRVTFGAVGSTSQHIGPAQVLADLGLAYGTDYQPEIIARNVAIEALVRGDVAAVGMNETHLQSIREAFPDQAFTVVARGRDLPNDVLVARNGIDANMLAKLRDVFQTQGEALMAAILQGDDNKKYEGGFFLTDVADSDYDYVRSMYSTVGVDTAQFIE
jgi:phosphonate transport system substrate-binding protein